MKGWQYNRKAWRIQSNSEKQKTVPSPSPAFQNGEGKLKTPLRVKTDGPGNTLAILTARSVPTSSKP
jgi:hypothetical protein